jgi:hypothetical protein
MDRIKCCDKRYFGSIRSTDVILFGTREGLPPSLDQADSQL